MHFKNLEIVGFKSFLNKTKLKFEPGVTAIVGPNGCGKSNVVDAIKWVLGTQSTKAMRSASMQDVIFNGTEKHEAVNFAEVSLTLSNEDRTLPVDYDEVIISRRLFRSGESEYLINKTPVRLQDVRNLLAGTGIGTSSYSIVEQGRMDMVISSKPDERRYIFEEASGITRYKAKKHEAMLKLERTKENLSRVSDIIHEVERQIKSIERQARKAERYKMRFEELKDLEIKYSAKKLRDLTSDDTSLDSESDKVRERTEQLAAALEEASAGLSSLRQEFNSVMEELQGRQNEMFQLSSNIDKNTHVIQVNRERIQELQKSVERLDWEIEEVTERRDVMTSRLETLRSRFTEISEKRQAKETELVSAEENIDEVTRSLDQHRAQLQSDREKTIDIVTEQTKTKNELIRTNADIQNTSARQRRLKMELSGVQAEKDRIGGELARLEEKAGEVRAAVDDREREYNSFNEEFISSQQKLSSLKDEKVSKEKKINEIKPRRQFLERLIAEREGVGDCVKEIMKRTESGDPLFCGVHGILSELVSVRDGFEESMESVIGDASHALVVEDRDVAGRVMRFLAENSMESVHILVLEELRRAMDAAPGEGPGLDDITQVLVANEPYASAVKELLSGTFMTASSEDAGTYLAGNAGFRGRIICEKGEIYARGLRRTRNFSNKEVIPLFGRREKVREMIEEERALSADIEKLEWSIGETEAWLREAEQKRRSLESQLREKQMEYADISSRMAAVKERVESIEQELLMLNTEIDEETGNMKQLVSEKERCEKLLAELDAGNSELQEAIRRAQEKIQELTTYKEETFYLVSDLKVELSGLRKEEENISDNLSRENETFNRMSVDVESKRTRIAESGERIKALEEEIRALGDEIQNGAGTIESRKAEIAGMEERKNALTARIAAEEEMLRNREKDLESLRDRGRDHDIRRKELEYRKSSIVEKLKDSYKVDISLMNVEMPEDINWEEAAAKIADLKDQIEKMGEVSLGAVEEHKELEERFQFLTRQRDDLESGKDQLMQAIQKINRTTRKMFMDTFEGIRKEFNDYFRMLFNGGKAELILEDENNVLECGIDIVVRPPGKKLHNIMQLSGGEKAMTAIALIFAIFKVNPSPFCILDEIDAPLDESNIVRFCRVLQEFLKLSQFIVVTHNRMTIQLADVLYGITMEEKGVSKMVSVKFAEEKEIVDNAQVGAAA